MAEAKILIVEDEGIEALGIQHRLINLGYPTPDIAFSGEEAIQKVEEMRPDLVLMDIMLAGEIDGVTAAEKIHTRFGIPIIYLTAYADESTLQRAKITEPYGYILKPFKERELHGTIDMALYKHRMERKLKESERWLATTLRSIGDGVIATDKEGVITFMNAAAESLTGWPLEEIVRKPLAQVFNIINRDTRLPVENPVTRVIREGIVVGLANHTLLIRRDGREIPIDDSGAPIKDDQGDIIGVILVFRDVTGRERAMEEIRRYQNELEFLVKERTKELTRANRDLTANAAQLEQEGAKLEAVLRQMPSAVVIAEAPSGRLLYGNEQVSHIFRHPFIPSSHIEEYGKWKIFHPEDGRPYLNKETPMARSVLYGETVINEEVDILRGDGTRGTVSASSCPVRNSQGKIMASVVVFHDITEQKKLEEMRSRLAAIVESSDEAIISKTLDGIIITWNRGAEKIYGYSAKEAIGRPISLIFPPDRLDELSIILEKLKKGESVEHYETVRVRKDGKRIMVNLTISPIRDKVGNIVAASTIERDITEQKRMEEELQKMQKLESIGILAGGIAHDFRNVLTGVIGSLSLLKLYLKPQGNNLALFTQAEEASDRAAELAQQLLTFARGGAPVKKLTSIRHLLKEIVDFNLQGSNTRCEFSIPEDLWPAEVDEGQMSQAVGNLIINAREAMPDGGTIHVSAENVIAGLKDCLPLDEGRYLKISIKDKGMGIPDEIIGKIFDPYFTTKDVGSGMGLAITYSIIQRHGGYITVESQKGAGTTFFLYLPASGKEAFHLEGIEEAAPCFGEGRILIMDDQEVVRQSLDRMLKGLGYQVISSSNGGEALELYKKGKEAGEPFEAVILDLTVPGGMGGIEALKRLLAMDPEIKAIVSSGYSTDPIMTNYRQFGFTGVIVKPYNAHQLGKVLDEVMS
ncbi:MAG: PAS domain S-box protein [bacterium]